VLGLPLTATADARGHFVLGGIPAGAHTLTIAYGNLPGLSLPITVTSNNTVNLNRAADTVHQRRWTVLVYMNADNDLEQFGMINMNEMEAVAAGDAVSVVVQMDRAAGFDATDGDWTGAKRFLIRYDDNVNTITSPVLEEIGEIDMGDPAALREFIAWGQSTFPAEHYLLIIWNHGSGWRGRTSSAPTRGVSFDDSSGAFIRTVDLPGAVQATPRLDVIAFDASLMQMLEIAYQMRDSCDFLVGSEESPPGHGYPYHYWLERLVARPTMTPRELGDTLATEMLRYYGTNSNITQSVLDMREVGGVAQAVDALGQALLAAAPAHSAALTDARDAAEHFAYIEYKDLYDYAARIRATVDDAQVRAATDGVMAAVERLVVTNVHGTQHPAAHGISIYVPAPQDYAISDTQYSALDFARDTVWDAWLAGQP
jgi:hypothetical protein